MLKASNANRSGRTNVSDLAGKVPQAKLDTCARLGSAHQNGLESLALFAGGVAACLATGAPIGHVNMLAKVHVASRIVYNIAYAAAPVANGLPRSATWGVSLATSVMLWIAANSAYSVL